MKQFAPWLGVVMLSVLATLGVQAQDGPEAPPPAPSVAPAEPAPEKPVDPAPADPAPAEPAPEEPADPAPEQPADPAPERPSDPAPEQPADPAPERPSDPAPEQPAEPAPEQPAKPAPEQPAKPAPEQPAKPAPEQPAEPAPEQPAEPAPAEPAPEKPAEPAPAEPAPEKPAEPAPKSTKKATPKAATQLDIAEGGATIERDLSFPRDAARVVVNGKARADLWLKDTVLMGEGTSGEVEVGGCNIALLEHVTFKVNSVGAETTVVEILGVELELDRGTTIEAAFGSLKVNLSSGKLSARNAGSTPRTVKLTNVSEGFGPKGSLGSQYKFRFSLEFVLPPNAGGPQIEIDQSGRLRVPVGSPPLKIKITTVGVSRNQGSTGDKEFTSGARTDTLTVDSRPSKLKKFIGLALREALKNEADEVKQGPPEGSPLQTGGRETLSGS